jgi:hypothetical protein
MVKWDALRPGDVVQNYQITVGINSSPGIRGKRGLYNADIDGNKKRNNNSDIGRTDRKTYETLE